MAPPPGPLRLLGEYVFALAHALTYTTVVVGLDAPRSASRRTSEPTPSTRAHVDAVHRRPATPASPTHGPDLRAIVESAATDPAR